MAHPTTALVEIIDTARNNGWEVQHTVVGPTFARKTAVGYEAIDITLTSHNPPRLHHAWLTSVVDSVSGWGGTTTSTTRWDGSAEARAGILAHLLSPSGLEIPDERETA